MVDLPTRSNITEAEASGGSLFVGNSLLLQTYLFYFYFFLVYIATLTNSVAD